MHNTMQLLPLLLLLVAAASLAAGQNGMYPLQCDTDSEGCFRNPVGCPSLYSEGKIACSYLATWRRVSDGIEIEIGGQVGSDRGYVALGFFPTSQRDGGIAASCYKSAADDRVITQIGYYKSQKEFEFLSTSLLAQADSAPSFDKDKPYLGGQFQKVPAINRGILECRMKLLVDASREPRLKFLKDVEDPSVRVMGSLNNQNPLKPDKTGLRSPTWWDITPSRPLSATGDKIVKESSGAAKAHGCFMVLAWVFCASVGTLLARYYKLQWPSLVMRKQLVWFQMHRALMITCCVLTVLSFIIIFIDLRGYSGLDTFPDLLHPIIGIIVTILTFINPFIALLRCSPTDDNRPWFNWIHWIIGTIAYVLAILNLFLGLRQERAGRLRSIDYHIWLLIFFVLFQFVIEIILEIHTLYHWKRNKKRWQAYRRDVELYQSHQLEGAIAQPIARPVEPRPAGYCLRTFLLVLHGVVAAAVALILVIVILAY